jgi:hypothetical protein
LKHGLGWVTEFMVREHALDRAVIVAAWCMAALERTKDHSRGEGRAIGSHARWLQPNSILHCQNSVGKTSPTTFLGKEEVGHRMPEPREREREEEGDGIHGTGNENRTLQNHPA